MDNAYSNVVIAKKGLKYVSAVVHIHLHRNIARNTQAIRVKPEFEHTWKIRQLHEQVISLLHRLL